MGRSDLLHLDNKEDIFSIHVKEIDLDDYDEKDLFFIQADNQQIMETSDIHKDEYVI